MRKLVRQIVDGYKSISLEGQDEGYVVFTGTEPESKQSVLIKILPRSLVQDPKVAQRFQGLARTIRQLNHPNILAVREVGEQEGIPYLVTRALERAKPLAATLDQPWAVDMAADLTMQVGQALEHAYNKGLIHGSLSPKNILVEDNGRVLVTDFGLSGLQELAGLRLQDAASPYLAPERAAGQVGDARSDVYSLAAVLYGMLAQRKPQIVAGEVLPPSRFNTDVPQAMDAVVVKALSPDPAKRFSDIRSFLLAFGAVSLSPIVEQVSKKGTGTRCPRCNTENQDGRFCRKCGTRLAQALAESRPAKPKSMLDEPIQLTRVDVGRIEVGEGVEVRQTVIARPMAVVDGELADQFPEPLDMPIIDPQGLWPDEGSQIAMPEPPPMPVIDWATIAPPMPEVPVFEDIPGTGEGD